MKRTLKISIILIVVTLVFSLFDRGCNGSIRVPLFCLFALTAFLSFWFAVIFLCRRKWRSKAKISSFITLASVMCSIIVMTVCIPYDPYDTAEKEVANYINNYNENNENSLELIKLYEDSIPRYDYVAECTMTIAGSTEKKEVFLYCDVSDSGAFVNNNGCCEIVETQGLNNYGFSENEIKIIYLGSGGDGRLLDSTLEDYSGSGKLSYSRYYEGLMSLVANKIDEQLVNNEVGYYDEYGNCVIDLTIQSPCVTIENPYVLVRFFDDDNKEIMKKTQKISATFDHKRTTVSLNLGKLTGASRFKISVLANEVFSKEWLENYLLNEYIWTGEEYRLDYYYNFKEYFLDDPDWAQIFYIEQFDLENSSK